MVHIDSKRNFHHLQLLRHVTVPEIHITGPGTANTTISKVPVLTVWLKLLTLKSDRKISTEVTFHITSK